MPENPLYAERRVLNDPKKSLLARKNLDNRVSETKNSAANTTKPPAK